MSNMTVTVTKLDGATEAVPVQEVPLRDLPKLFQARDDEPKMIAIATGKPESFCDTITPESHIELITAVDAVNAEYVRRWFKRRVARTERLFPGQIDKRIVEAAGK